MSDENNFGFAKLVPGFDFLQNLAKGASQTMSQMPQPVHFSNSILSIMPLHSKCRRPWHSRCGQSMRKHGSGT